MSRARRHRGRVLAICLATLGLGSCYAIGSRIDQTREPPASRRIEPGDIALPDGLQIDAVATDLTWPVGVTFDEAGTPYVVESGFSYDWRWDTARLLRIGEGGRKTVVAESDVGPWLGVDYADGAFFISEAGADEGGRLLRVERDGTRRVLVSGLPGHGDHHTNGPVVGPDGFVYVGQGTATNSAVVGIDNYDYGWLARRPDYHDTPCRDVTLVGRNFRTDNPLTPEDDDEAVTGAFLPFGVPSTPGQVIEGRLPCNGAVMRVPKEGGELELVAWGFRNPFGLAFSPDGRLFVTDNSYDDRGSRPVFGAADWLWEVVPGAWHGWPDFAGGRPLFQSRYGQADVEPPERLLAAWPNEPPKATAFFGVHASADGIDFARTDTFAPTGTAFVAEFGDMAPETGGVVSPVGYRVVTVDTETGVITPFATNRGRNGPASRGQSGGLERPVDVGFSPSGDALYIVDFGIMTMNEQENAIGTEPRPVKGTGVLWRVTRRGTTPVAAR